MGLKYRSRRASNVDPFDYAWSVLKRDIDGDENDDEFVDGEQFNEKAPRTAEQILSMVGLDDSIEECYSCGLEGSRSTFTQRNKAGRLERRCPECGSESIHGKNAYQNVPDRSNESYEDERARRNAYYRDIEEKLRHRQTGVPSGNE